jgi:hypothetical protein
MPAQLIERALAEWRDGERLLREMPRLDPDHETVRLAVTALRETFHSLAGTSAATKEQLERGRARIDAAHDVIARVQSKLGPRDGAA